MKIERINDWFARQGRWMVQKRWLVLSLFILVFAIGFTGLRYFKVSASWENYFLEDDPMLVKTKEFKDIFGNDNFAADPMRQFVYERELRAHPRTHERNDG